MTSRTLSFLVFFIAALFIAGCETVDPPPAIMTEAVFASELQAAKQTRPAKAAETRLTVLLGKEGLTEDMRVRALFERGSLRRLSGLNRRAALKDFDDLLALDPDHYLASNARIERRYVQDDIQRIEQRRRSGKLQTISEWFDDAWSLGNREAAAARYRKSGLSPTVGQVRLLIDAGYICKTGGTGPSVYNYGDRRSDLTGLKWCQAAQTG